MFKEMKYMIEKKCQLTKEQCDKLEDMRIYLWDKTFSIQKSSKDIKKTIEEIQDIVAGTEQDRSTMSNLDNMKNTVDFLMIEPGTVTELYRYHDKEFKKPYRQFGYFNNIIHEIKDNCKCNIHHKK